MQNYRICVQVWLALGMLIALAVPRTSAAHDGLPEMVVSNQQTGPYRLTVFADPDVAVGYLVISLFVTTPDGATEAPPPGTTILVHARPDLPVARTSVQARAVQEPSIASTFRAETPFTAPGQWIVTLQIRSPAGHTEVSFPLQIGDESLWSLGIMASTAGMLGILITSVLSRWVLRHRERQHVRRS